MDTTYKSKAARPVTPDAGGSGQSGEGSGSLMEQLVQQERKRAAQRPVEYASHPAPEESRDPPAP